MTEKAPDKATTGTTGKLPRWDSLREVFVPSLVNLRVWLLQFFGGIVIALAVAWFLRTGETLGQLILGGLLIVTAVVIWLTLDGGTFNYYLDQQRSQTSAVKPAFVRALKHILPLAIVACVFFLLRMLVDKLDDYHYSVPGYLRSEFPAWLRRMVSETRVQNLYDLFVFFLRWIVLPALLLPFASLCADRGFRGIIAIRIWARMFRNRAFWGVLIVASILGVLIPAAILGWKLDPRTATSTSEGAFLGFRLFLGYLLVLGAWMMASSMLARARMKAEAAPAADETKIKN
jgi:hypothetical protein